MSATPEPELQFELQRLSLSFNNKPTKLDLNMIRHDYICLMRNTHFDELKPQEINALSSFHASTKHQFSTGNMLYHDQFFSPQKAQLKLSRDYTMRYKWAQTRYPNVLSQRAKLAVGGVVLLFGYELHHRVSWYMEHSFDILSPNIRYIVHRFY